jgi:plasmid stabilization system protein ParE
LKRYRVIVPRNVEDQIVTRVLQIAEDSLENAIKWESRLRTAIQRIGDEPHGFPVDRIQSRQCNQTVRKYVFERTYLLFFIVDEFEITVVLAEFCHGSRQR